MPRRPPLLLSLTKWTRLVHPFVLTGHVSSLSRCRAACGLHARLRCVLRPPRVRAPPQPHAPRPLCDEQAAVYFRWSISGGIFPTTQGTASRAACSPALPVRGRGSRRVRGAARGRGCGRRCRPPPFRTKWTRRVPHQVLTGHAASLTPFVAELCDRWGGGCIGQQPRAIEGATVRFLFIDMSFMSNGHTRIEYRLAVSATLTE